MRKVVVALFQVPDGRYVFQRRTDDAPVNAGLLGFFGGHVEDGESLDEAIKRELGEETSLNIGELTTSYNEKFVVDREGELIEYHLYNVPIEAADFKVYEGLGAEPYDLESVSKRDDLTSSVKYVVEKLIKKG